MENSPISLQSPIRTNVIMRRSPCCQYRATRLWNELVQTFRDHIKCKTHRRNLRNYFNCFTGSAALNVMFAVLKENKTLTMRVTKKQAAKLLQKFLERHIIEDINGKWETEKFASNKTLFRFPSDLHSSNALQISSGPLKRSSAILMMISGNKSLSPCRGIHILSPPLSRRIKARMSNRALGSKFPSFDRRKLEVPSS